MPVEPKPELVPVGNVIDMGDIPAVAPGDKKATRYSRCLLIQFASEDDLKAAIRAMRVTLTIHGE